MSREWQNKDFEEYKKKLFFLALCSVLIPILYEDAQNIKKRTAFSTRGFRQRVRVASRREASRSLLASRREEKNPKN
ncbi:MAG: hypothetical protein RMY28_021695 [Nostoc sp. ChiSLP01]|nr:hypothetical protein [Nostoc sp. CmiSLP01]MDZ8282726.1 hypothetical protein [Nostoc sp. ChiSLP01]